MKRPFKSPVRVRRRQGKPGKARAASSTGPPSHHIRRMVQSSPDHVEKRDSIDDVVGSGTKKFKGGFP